MVHAVQTPQRAAIRLLAWIGRAPWAKLAELAARGGYLARGFVYVSVGAVALLAALDLTPEPKGAVGALQAWGRWPIGILLLWLTGAGLYAFAGWRALQSLFDADGQGTSPKALASRAGQAISGVLYAAMAVSVFGVLDALEDLNELDDQAATRAAIATALSVPYGDLLVVGAGLFVVAAGIGNIVRAALDHFGRGLDCPPGARAWTGTLARVGYLARGIAFLPAGAYLTGAGLNARASDARGVGGALAVLAERPFGDLILGVLAVGLIAFGLFAFVEARFRPIRPQDAVTP